MENLREELERFSLLSGYNSKLTLTENKTILINEQGFFAKFLTTFSDDAIKLLARDIESFSSVSKYGKDSETFLKDLRSGSKAAKGLVGEFVKDILKSDKILQSNRGLYDQAIDAYTRQLAGSSESFAKQFKNASKADKATMLRNAKYPERAINRIIKKTEEFAGVGAKEAEVVAKDFESVAQTGKEMSKEATKTFFQKYKDRFMNYYNRGKGKIDRALKSRWIKNRFLNAAGKISKRKLLAWAAVIGVSYLVLKSWLESQGIQEESLTPEQKLARAKKCGHKSWDAYKNSGWSCGRTGSSNMGPNGGRTYKSCSGTYSLGCESERITKVQGCLNELLHFNDDANKMAEDGKFGKKTQEALKQHLGKTTFTDAEAHKICQDALAKVTKFDPSQINQDVDQEPPVDEPQATQTQSNDIA
jgi:hypothetical protein